MQSLVSVSSSCRLLDLTAEHCSSLYTCLPRYPLKGDWSTRRDRTRVSISDLESGRSQGAKATWPTPSIPAQQGRRGSHEVQDTVVLGWMPRAGGHQAAQCDPSQRSACARGSQSSEGWGARAAITCTAERKARVTTGSKRASSCDGSILSHSAH